MNDDCYESMDMKRIDAVKELFDNFATRTMAYDFHHVIGLVKFDSLVKTLHPFTETLEKFKVISPSHYCLAFHSDLLRSADHYATQRLLDCDFITSPVTY